MSKVTIYSPPSAAQVKNCTADFDLRHAPVPIHLVQFDKTIPILAVALYKGGTAYKLPEDAEANVRMGKRNNLYVYNPVLGCNEGRTLVYVAVTPQMTTQDGVFYPILEVLAGGGVAGTSPLQLVIQRNPVQEGDLEDTSEAQTLADLVSQAAASANAAADSARIVQENKDAIQNANENIEAIKAAPANAKAAAASAKEARSWAVGDTASRPGEGMDNAKYYAALAQQVSQGAVGWYPNYEALYAAHDTGYDGNWAIVGDTDTIWVWDSDTGVWKDTGESSKFANYYDKTQIDENFYGKAQIDANFYNKTQIDENFYDKTQIDAKLPKPVTVTVAASAWTSGDYTVSWDDGSTTSYTTCATVTVAGVTADSRIAVSDRTRVTDAVRMVAALEPGAGAVKFYTNAAPTSAAVFVLEVSQ
ncbi:hypothetical protein [Gemmiger formicilis]|uniref:hypothetical protein n=1 Tax=Gemmiger formicilis TaxID=745368 RepID=UPI0022E0FD30|nr:hypothetical protein [Gemmiger formicilis]